jgi:hypothetical protein
MLLDRYYKISEKSLIIFTVCLLSITAVMIIYFPFFYLYIIQTTISLLFLLAFSFKKFIFYAVNCLFVLVLLLYSWDSIDIIINKSNYYNTFEPLTAQECIAGYDLIKEEITQNVHCTSLNLTKKDSLHFNKLYNNSNNTIKHLKQLGCYSVEVWENSVQLWYDDWVVNIEKENNTLHYSISQLH